MPQVTWGSELSTCTKCVLTLGGCDARQYEFDIVGEKWMCIKYEENQAYRYSLFLHEREG